MTELQAFRAMLQRAGVAFDERVLLGGVNLDMSKFSADIAADIVAEKGCTLITLGIEIEPKIDDDAEPIIEALERDGIVARGTLFNRSIATDFVFTPEGTLKETYHRTHESDEPEHVTKAIAARHAEALRRHCASHSVDEAARLLGIS